MFRTIHDVKVANDLIDNHFFDPATMRFFNSRVETDLIDGRFFVTSEKGPNGIRAFTVREAKPDGSIDTVGEFQEHATLKSAVLVAVQAHRLDETRRVESTDTETW
jgi:hypothetical protein